MDFVKEIEKMGITVEQYENCIRDIQDKIEGNIDLDWEEIRDKYNLPMSVDGLRKSNAKPFGGAFIKGYLESKQDTFPASYEAQRDALRREKVKLSDERSALRKISREAARAEENLAMLEDLIRENGKTTFAPLNIHVDDNGNDLIACLSDFHIGINADTTFGKYDSDIAKDRLCQYIVEIVKIQRLHHSQNIYLTILGDNISGDIHPTVQLENRENVVTQIQMAAEAISAFAYELSKHFQNVYIADVPGNHSRIGLKDSVLRDERLDDLVVWYMTAKLECVKNIHFIGDKYDATINSISVRGNEFLLTHGDFDSFSEKGLNKLCMFIGHKPTGILIGHLHHSTFDDINDVKMIRSGSFVGTCDNYTIQNRLYSKPSQMVCVIEESGIKALYPVELK